MSGISSALLGSGPHSTPGNAEQRKAIAARADTAPELLVFLAADPAPDVRIAVAQNAAAPAHANRLLVEDADPSVRIALARKVAKLAPGLKPDEVQRLRKLTWTTLCMLASDAADAVREALADAVKEMSDAPREIVLQLARDLEFRVADPVLRLSPLLTEDDLLDLLAEPRTTGTASSIAARIGVQESVSDRIASLDDTQAITVLLGNRSAQIREDTLDMLAERARPHVEWHGKLVERANLPGRAARLLAGFVAEDMLRRLAERADLDPETRAAVGAAVTTRITGSRTKPTPRARQQGHRDREAEALDAAAHGDAEELAHLLSLGSGVSITVVQRAARLRSARGLVAITWRAGLSMRVAVAAQSLLASLPPSELILPASGGEFPFRPDEMKWHLDTLLD